MGEKGQSLVEFAVSLVVILILLAGAVEFGIGLFQLIQMNDAAQEGAIYGSICQDVQKIEDRVRHASSSPLDLQNESVVVLIDFVDTYNNPVSYSIVKGGVRVRVQYTHKMFMPFLAGREILLKSEVTNTILSEGNCR